jgi:hypothetical protein
MNDELGKRYGARTITLAMHMAMDFDKQYPNENRKYSELVLLMIPAAVQIVLVVGL